MIKSRRLMQRMAVALIFAGGLVLIPQAASASTTANTDTFSESWSFVSTPLTVCITFTLKGTITYQATAMGSIGGTHFSVHAIHLNDPVLKAVVRHWTLNSGCTLSSENLSKISLDQHWTGYSCSFNPTLSVAAPWGVAVSGWPSCGNRKQASYSSEYSTGSTYTQNNTAAQATFGNQSSVATKPTVCFGVFVSAVAYEKTASDSYASGNGSSAKKFCLTPTF